VKISKKFFGFTAFIVDSAIVYASYMGIFYLKTHMGKPYSVSNFTAVKEVLPYILFVFVLLFFLYRLHEVEELDFYETFLGIVFTSIILAFLALSLSFFLRAFALPRTLILYSFIFQIVFLSIFHYFNYRLYTKIVPPLKGVLISFNEKRAIDAINYIKSVKGNRLFMSSFILNDDKNLNKIPDKFDMVFVDSKLPLKDKEEITRFFAYKNKPLYVLPDIYELLLLNPEVHNVGDRIVLEIGSLNISWVNKFLKRLLDISVSLVALVLFSPILLVVSVLILLDDGKPIFYLQKRAGINGKIFNTIKFRTMIKDAEKDTGAVLSNENDPRVTKIGKFLRKTGIDEVPQFINVLRGEMSVVGPRPERPELIEKIKRDVPDYDIRLNVKPGITGFAQIYGKYDTPFEEKLKMDIAYVKQKYLFFADIYVILNTVKLFFLPQKRK
jgi:exopolysaccharide biosynthesis polyprenyl glycosylphosphotransferase